MINNSKKGHSVQRWAHTSLLLRLPFPVWISKEEPQQSVFSLWLISRIHLSVVNGRSDTGLTDVLCLCEMEELPSISTEAVWPSLVWSQLLSIKMWWMMGFLNTVTKLFQSVTAAICSDAHQGCLSVKDTSGECRYFQSQKKHVVGLRGAIYTFQFQVGFASM